MGDAVKARGVGAQWNIYRLRKNGGDPMQRSPREDGSGCPGSGVGVAIAGQAPEHVFSGAGVGGAHWAGYWGSLQGPSGDQMGDQVSQQALEGAFLVGLVGDIR